MSGACDPALVRGYRHHLDRFEAYLQRIGVRSLSELSPAVLSAFIIELSAAGLVKSSVRDSAGVLRVLLRYAHREGATATHLSGVVEWPQLYRLSNIPRSISWDDVNRVLAAVDRRTEAGKRDYAILLLLVTYGLRGREVAALTLDDRLEARALGGPGAQGRPLDRLPPVGGRRRGASRLSAPWPAIDPGPPHVLPGSRSSPTR